MPVFTFRVILLSSILIINHPGDCEDQKEKVSIEVIKSSTQEMSLTPDFCCQFNGDLTSSIKDLAGIPSSGSMEYIPSLDGKAIHLKPDQFVSFPNNNIFTNVPLTLALTFKHIAAKSVVKGNPCLFAIRSLDQVFLSVHFTPDMKYIILWNGSKPYQLNLSESLQSNQWHHLTVVISQKETKLFLDGQRIEDRGMGPCFGSGINLPLILGASNPTGFESYQWVFDSIAVFHKDLTADEVDSVYQNSGIGTERKKMAEVRKMQEIKKREVIKKINDSSREYQKIFVQQDSLAGYWTMDGMVNDIFSIHSSTLNGGSEEFQDGPIAGSKGILLKNGTFIKTPDQPGLDHNRCTLCFFFMIPEVKNESYNPTLIAKRDTTGVRYSVHYTPDLSSVLTFDGNQITKVELPEGKLEPGRWYHFAWMMTGSEGRVFIDGARCFLVPGTPSPTPAGMNIEADHLPLLFGSASPDGAEQGTCGLAEVALYEGLLPEKTLLDYLRQAGWGDQVTKAAGITEKARSQKAEEKWNKIRNRLEDPELLAKGSQKIYRKEYLDAVSLPVGGIGSGLLQVNGHGELSLWQIFNNFDQVRIPDSFFAVRMKDQKGNDIVRTLQGKPFGPFDPLGEVEFTGEYPFGWYRFIDDSIPVEVSMETFNPFIPGATRDSSIPCAIFTFSFENTTNKPVDMSLLANIQNSVGYQSGDSISGRFCRFYGDNRNQIIETPHGTLLYMTSDRGKLLPGSGQVGLLTLGEQATGCADSGNLEDLSERFSKAGKLPEVKDAGPSPQGETLNGALTLPIRLSPGEKREITYILTWYFPNVSHGDCNAGWLHIGNMYCNWWKDAQEVTMEVAERFSELRKKTKTFHDTIYASNFPYWLLDRLTSQLAILRSKTLYWAKDGYLGVWEGVLEGAGCCFGNCSHVWHYAQAHAWLFPDLARRMREQTLSYQLPGGGLPHRHPGHPVAFDGEVGDILNTWREHLLSKDKNWMIENWPATKRAIDHLINTWDADEDGILQGAQANTLDTELGGSTSWLGSMYLASLAAGEQMALLADDQSTAARYRKIHKSGARIQDETLWNGEYYIQIPDPEPRADYLDGCAIDQVLGEWWAKMLNLETAYPVEHVQTALKSMVKYNFQPEFHGIVQLPRKFVDDPDAGMQMIKWPHGPRPKPCILYGDEVMSGFEYSAAATMVQYGLIREGFAIVKAAYDRYDGRLKDLGRPFAGAFRTTGNPFGDDECGRFYGRALSIWSMLLACQGIEINGPEGLLGFHPVWQAEDHVSFFSSAAGWGLYSQKKKNDSQVHNIEIRHGSLYLKKLSFSKLTDKPVRTVKMELGGKSLPASFTVHAEKVFIQLRDGLVLDETNPCLIIQMEW